MYHFELTILSLAAISIILTYVFLYLWFHLQVLSVLGYLKNELPDYTKWNIISGKTLSDPDEMRFITSVDAPVVFRWINPYKYYYYNDKESGVIFAWSRDAKKIDTILKESLELDK